MADFYAPQFQNPDLLRSAALGQQMGTQAALAPGEVQGQQQQLQAGQLSMQQLQQTLAFQRMKMGVLGGVYNNMVGQSPDGPMPSTQTGQQPGGGAGGIQSGPQASIQGQNSPQMTNALSARDSTLLGLIDPEALKGASAAQDYQTKQKQFQAQGPLNLIDTIFNSDQPAKTAMMNQSIMSQWPHYAQQLGVDPVTGFNDANVRKALALAGNGVRGMAGMPPKEYPAQLQTIAGPNGQVLQRDPVTGKDTEAVGQKLPSFALEKRWNPATGKEEGMMVQTSPGGSAAPQAALGGAPSRAPAASSVPGATGGLGQQASAPIDLGYQKPSDPQLKAAMFGSEMRSGMNTLNKLESSGFTLSPKTRTLLLNAATSEDEGMIKQLFSQEALVHMSPKEQTYIAALMPMLQAAGHDQSGARLTTSQVRQNIESLLPIDVKNKDALEQVRQNRQGFYVGLLTQAGPAAQLPQYKDTLAADLTQAQGKASAKAAPAVGTIVKGHKFLGGDPSKQSSWQAQ